MTNYLVDLNTMLAGVCFNGGKSNKLFRVRVEDTRRVEDIWYEHPSIDSVGRTYIVDLVEYM
ncbi:hypothetical protein MtrunA17_Chr3g0104141 [Medicago truncatula]|uniref:Uncharacterized protein n=1 Tax=Medicago truncatula TaxID=3880 RepID=A0A396IUC0_MEDTR|nr:hypothetical protein MtrunA17_Chr3g0104141 [Medicago truncatula]